MNITKKELIDLLSRFESTIVFRKSNGEIRIMDCTLKAEAIPNFNPSYVAEDNGDENLVKVWDTKLEEWRSFHIDSVAMVTLKG